MIEILGNIYLVESKTSCWKCGTITPVYSLFATSINDLDEKSVYNCVFLSFVTTLPNDIAKYLRHHYPLYKKRFSKQVGQEYFMNHCASCQSPIGDFYEHNEPGGAFFPFDKEDARKIRFISTVRAKRPVIVNSSYGISSVMADCNSVIDEKKSLKTSLTGKR